MMAGFPWRLGVACLEFVSSSTVAELHRLVFHDHEVSSATEVCIDESHAVAIVAIAGTASAPAPRLGLHPTKAAPGRVFRPTAAADAGSAGSIRMLATAKANLEARKDDAFPTPLLWAVSQRPAASVSALVAAGARGHVFKTGDKSALTLALELGRLDMVRDLLKAGARPNEPIGDHWKPALHLALPHCGKLQDGSGADADFHVDLLRTLVEAGADHTAKDEAGLTPADAVAKRLADATHPYYKYCFQQKVDYLRTLR